MEKEKTLSRYLEAVDGCLRAFNLNISPSNEDIKCISLNTKQFTTALKELYFSENPQKEEHYVLLHTEISKATFHINDDNLISKDPNIWKPICHALKIAESYTSELRFKETNNYFPFVIDVKTEVTNNTTACGLTEWGHIESVPVFIEDCILLNMNLNNAINRIKNIFEKGESTLADVDYLKNLYINYEIFNFIPFARKGCIEELKDAGISTFLLKGISKDDPNFITKEEYEKDNDKSLYYQALIIKHLNDALINFSSIFDNQLAYKWDKKIQTFKAIVILNVEGYDYLFNYLVRLCSFFEFIPLHILDRYLEKSIGFGFSERKKLADNEPDLLKKKQIFAEGMAQLEFSLLGEKGIAYAFNKHEYPENIKKYKKAIQVLDEQIKHSKLEPQNIETSKQPVTPLNGGSNITNNNVVRNQVVDFENTIDYDIITRDNYNKTHINDFCNFLTGRGDSKIFFLDDAVNFTKSKMFDYIKINTDNFDVNKFKYFIEDLRDYSNHISFNLKKKDNHTIEYDHISGERMEFTASGLAYKDYHFSDNNDFTSEQIEKSQFFEKVVFDTKLTLTERIEILKTNIPKIHFPGQLSKLFQFSEIAEEEYAKVTNNVKIVSTPIIEKAVKDENQLIQGSIKTRFDKLKYNLSNYGFYDLPMIKSLTHPKKEELISIMSTKSVDYCIAMFDYLGYIKHLKPQYFDSIKEMNNEIALWLGSNERTIQGQISILKPNSREKKGEYKSYLEVENVKNDYNRIKNS